MVVAKSLFGVAPFLVLIFLFYVLMFGLTVYILILIIRALKKYINSNNTKENIIIQQSLGESIKNHRMRCNMTQEFVAEKLGVSRQAVSKWESGKSDPSTANLIALAKLYGISIEELLKNIQ